jgi:hypothetical protein
MRSRRGFAMVAGPALVLTLLLGAAPGSVARARAVVVPPRPGQLGIDVSGLYGVLAQSGDLGDVFGSGPGVAVRLRYRMRYERGFGLTFEAHSFDPRAADSLRDFVQADSVYAAAAPFAAKKLNLFLYGVDFYQMFGTRTKTTKMLSVGAGIAHAVVALNDGEQEYPWGDGPYVSAGAGIEHFFWQSWGWTAGARYQAVFIGGKVNHDLQASVGLVFYASI